MAEPFKNAFNRPLIEGMAGHFKKHCSAFDASGFKNTAGNDLETLELKARSEQIMLAMCEYLPADFELAGEIMLASLSPSIEGDQVSGSVDENGISGWAIMPMADYVGIYGDDHFDLSMILFKALTKRFSSEFGIRYFLLREPDKTVAVMRNWAEDDDKHVRRLASEGIRPRLPWAMQLPVYIENPEPVIELLEMLKDDPDEYVRRSVANNLNDIAKDHPDRVVEIAAAWMVGAKKERKQLIRHACRTLIKQGNKKVLQLFGYAAPALRQVAIEVQTPIVEFGSALEFSLCMHSTIDREQPLIIDYVIHHQKANGKTSAKVFKWSTKTLAANQSLQLNRRHSIKKITTRVYYAGLHRVEVMVNGVSLGAVDFQLVMPQSVKFD